MRDEFVMIRPVPMHNVVARSPQADATGVPPQPGRNPCDNHETKETKMSIQQTKPLLSIAALLFALAALAAVPAAAMDNESMSHDDSMMMQDGGMSHDGAMMKKDCKADDSGKMKGDSMSGDAMQQDKGCMSHDGGMMKEDGMKNHDGMMKQDSMMQEDKS